jgi:hypothetical protein
LVLVGREQQHHQVLAQAAVILFLQGLLQRAAAAAAVGQVQMLRQVCREAPEVVQEIMRREHRLLVAVLEL